MDDTEALLGIGAFARKVGLAPSALRFYDDCGVLRPAHVDEGTGYRYYGPGQEARAVLVRRLREAGLPLTDASVVVDGAPEAARAVLEEHARRTRDTAAAAQAVIRDVLRGLRAPELTGERGMTEGRTAEAEIGGAELASAVRQVAPATATSANRERFPVLGCVLLELAVQEVRLVATDRYRMAVRTLRSPGLEGDPCRAAVPVEALRELAAWARGRPSVTVRIDGDEVRVRGGEEERTLPVRTEEFPSYRMILDELPSAVQRVITDREALRTALVGDGEADRLVVLRAGGQRLVLMDGAGGTAGPGRAEEVVLPALCDGPQTRIAFDPEVLLPAVEAGVGPDVLLEIAAADQPVVVRSADQGSFTTLVMPVYEGAPDSRAEVAR